MPYSWITTVTDRTEKSKYNATDVNRVDNNTRYLEEYLETNIGAIVDLSTYTTKDKTSLGKASLIELLEKNINTVKDFFGYDPLTWVTLAEDWAGGDSFLYSDANNLEKNLDTIKLNFEQIFQAFRECGTFNAGSKATRL